MPPLDLQGRPLRAPVLLSPWLRLKEDREAAVTNEAYDFIHAKQVDHFATLFNPAFGHMWANPIDTDGANTTVAPWEYPRRP